MRLGKSFSITVCTLDETRNTGGDRREFNDCQLVNFKPSGNAAPVATEPNGNTAIDTRNPQHSTHGTLNIMTRSGEVVKIHPVLIEKFNAQRVAI